VLPLMSGTELAVNARELAFIDHRGLLVLDRCAGQRGVRVAFRTPRQTVAQVAEAIGLQHMRVDLTR
jgi:hypothetical protein